LDSSNPAAYWRDLTTRYSIDALPESEKVIVQKRILEVLAGLLETDGKVSTGLGLRLLTAVAKV
jgi:hypothetical protein